MLADARRQSSKTTAAYAPPRDEARIRAPISGRYHLLTSPVETRTSGVSALVPFSTSSVAFYRGND